MLVWRIVVAVYSMLELSFLVWEQMYESGPLLYRTLLQLFPIWNAIVPFFKSRRTIILPLAIDGSL